ncbi:MAG: FCD domain-containing protein, partial [Myxococcota bacterium]
MSDTPRRQDAPTDAPPTPASASRKASLPIAAVWIVVSLIVAAALSRDGGLEISGDLNGLIPPAHRAPTGEPLVLLRVADDQLAADASHEEALLTAAQRVGDRMASERVPLAPPAAELNAWLDAHALFLLPLESHEALANALSEAKMQDSVDGLKARLSSPMFGVTGEQPRRDPLSLARLTDAAAVQLGDLADAGAKGARPTATGDLISHDGRALLIQLQSERAPAGLRIDVDNAIADLPVTATVVGAAANEAKAEASLRERLPRLCLITLAGITAVLALALRNVRAVLAIVACIASAVGAVVLMSPALGLLSIPLIALLAGFGCEGALHLQRISQRGWPAAGVLAGALAPLWLSPYPTWAEWSWRWAVGMLCVVVVLRVVLPSMTALLGGTSSWKSRGFRLRPARGLAVVLAAAALGTGAWSINRLDFRGLDEPLADYDPTARRVVRERFFDARRIVEAETPGRDATDAVTRAATDARALASLVPEHATRVDSPGSFVLPVPELGRRREALTKVNLDERMDVLFELLSSRGFRPDAFGEFLRGSSDLETMPTPQAALDGPLGPWIARSLVERDDMVLLRTRVHLRDATTPVPEVEREAGEPLTLHGPAVGARIDRASFRDWLGIYVALQLWVGAFVVWLGTRSLAVSIGATIAALTAQMAVLAASRRTAEDLERMDAHIGRLAAALGDRERYNHEADALTRTVARATQNRIFQMLVWWNQEVASELRSGFDAARPARAP